MHYQVTSHNKIIADYIESLSEAYTAALDYSIANLTTASVWSTAPNEAKTLLATYRN